MSSTLEEVQRNEIEALESIFADDFSIVHKPGKVAWGQYSPPGFKIRIEITEADISVSHQDCQLPRLTIFVQFSIHYPRSAPQIELIEPYGLFRADIQQLSQIIAADIQRLLGHEMVFDIVDHVRLQMAQLGKRKALTSLNAERNSRLVQHDLSLKISEDTQAALQIEEQAKDAAELQQKIEADLKATDLAQRRPLPSNYEELQLAVMDVIEFSLPLLIGRYSLTNLLKGVPVANEDSSSVRVWTTFAPKIGRLILKELCINSATGKQSLQAIESVARRSIHDTSTIQTSIRNYGICVQPFVKSSWRLFIAQEFAVQGSLQDLLNTGGSISLSQAQRWILDLAVQLSQAHRNNVIHRYIEPSKVLLRNTDNRVTAGLVDFEYAYLIHKEDVYFEASRISLSQNQEPRPSGRKSDDIADLGVLLLRMLCGSTAIDSAASIETFLGASGSTIDTDALRFVKGLVMGDRSKRPSAVDLVSSEFLRNSASQSIAKPVLPNSVETSVNKVSRYTNDFDELSELGHGAFGTVVKARNKLDGRVYAIKKIASITNPRVLREVSGLARLNHPSIVRYFGAWLEEDEHSRLVRSTTPTNETDDFSTDDFMSSSGCIEFIESQPGRYDGTKSVPDHSAERGREHKVALRTLFIQMELCSGDTLRKLIDDGQIGSQYWQYFAQIVGSVQYIHQQGLIHRDLKPANIFVDSDSQLKLGDFGLAAETDLEYSFRLGEDIQDDRTAEIGTFFYSAPELSNRSAYDAKVDVYALGIIFVELICHWLTGMERINAIRGLRSNAVFLPEQLAPPQYEKERQLLQRLLSHSPKARPTTTELSQLLPPVVPKEYIRDSLKLVEEDDSYKSAILTKLFAEPVGTNEYTYDIDIGPDEQYVDALDTHLTTERVNIKMKEIFKRHGAVERQIRPLAPLNALYSRKTNVMQVLDSFGNVLQLPYDLHIPYVRTIARSSQWLERSYIIAPVYRASSRSPQSFLEADFDIVSEGDSLEGAEVARVAFEIVQEFEELQQYHTTIHLGHSTFLRAIIMTASIPETQYYAVAEVLRRLSFGPGPQSITKWKRSLVSLINETSIEELFRFHSVWASAQYQSLDFDATLSAVLHLLEPRVSQEVLDAVTELKEFEQACKHYQIDISITFDPFVSDPDRYELGFVVGIGRANIREILCVGGRYDKLIRTLSVPQRAKPLTAWGVCFAVDKIVRLRIKNSPSGTSMQTKQVDVVLSSSGHEARSRELVARVWQAKISAVITDNAESSLAESARLGAIFLVTFKDKKTTAPQLLKVRNLSSREPPTEVTFDNLIPYLIVEIARQHHSNQQPSVPLLIRSSSQAAQPNVIFVGAEERKNKRQLISSKAIERVQILRESLQSGALPILIFDLDSEQMALLAATIHGDKRSSERLPRPQAQGLKDEIDMMREQGLDRAWAYSFRTTEVLLLHF